MPRYSSGLLVAATGACTALSTLAPPCSADVPARALIEALGRTGAPSLLRPGAGSGEVERVGVLFESAKPVASAVRVGEGLYYARRSASELEVLFAAHPEARASWMPPLRQLLDAADGWIAASDFRNQSGLAGEGVLVGVVDTGFDVRHGDLRNPDGSTRIAWLIDYSRGPLGLHPELEEQYGCTSEDLVCRILDRDDLNERLENDVIGDEPKDRRGHGTHVASLAAGSGLSQDPAHYVGVAPEAALVLAQVLGPDDSIDQAAVLAGTEFIFDRAREAGKPVAVNISLGTDFGAHDGSSLIERSLARFVNSGEPGRAIVVAAGNSAAQVSGFTSDYPEPLGVHTEVHVPSGTTARVPLLTFSHESPTRGSVFVWLESRPSDRLQIGFDDGQGSDVGWVDYGAAGSYAISGAGGDFQVTIVNAPSEPDAALGVGSGSAAVVISGEWQRGRTFVLHLAGHGSARLWIEGSGALAQSAGGGVFLPRSSKEGTITIPASHPELIAVGATLNRKHWPRVDGDDSVLIPPALDVPLDSVAYFSSAGPNALGALKPELVAPGANVIGAMSRDADPRDSTTSIFANPSCADAACQVVDDTHAVSAGTSMAAPLVTGAAALLMQRDPTLASGTLRLLLLAGTRAPEGEVPAEQQMGTGVLDLVGSLTVQDMLASDAERDALPPPSAEQSRLVLASSFVHPDPDWPVDAFLLLRDADARVTDAPDGTLRLEASGALNASLRRLAPGLWQVGVSAPSDAGQRTIGLRVLAHGKPIAEREVPIAVDRPVADAGFSAQGGCALVAPRVGSPWWIGCLLGTWILGRVRLARGKRLNFARQRYRATQRFV